MRTLRDRNYALQEENLKLREGREPPRTVDFRSRELLRDRNPVSTSLQSGKLPLGFFFFFFFRRRIVFHMAWSVYCGGWMSA